MVGMDGSACLKPTALLYGKELGIPCMLSAIPPLSAPDICRSKTDYSELNVAAE